MRTQKKIDCRRFLRPKSDEYGSDSTIRTELSVTKEPARTRGRHQIEARGGIDAYLSIRDCSESISIDFSASKKQKHMIAQFSVLNRIITDLEKMRSEYEAAIIELRDEGWLK